MKIEGEYIMAGPGDTLQEVEKAYILNILKFWDGNRTKAAIALGISTRSLQRKLSKWKYKDKVSRTWKERYQNEC